MHTSSDALLLVGPLGEPGDPVGLDAGTLGGECFRATCHRTGADWHHRVADRYYCEDCAADINLACKIKGEPPACRRR